MDGREVLVEIRKRYGDELAVIMISSNEQQQMVEACIRAGADSYLFKPLRIADFSNIWQFVMQQRCHKLQADRVEMRYLRTQQLARMKQLQAEKMRAVALADKDREKANREKAEAEAARQRVEQEAELDRQREDMQKEIMRLLHQQVCVHAAWPAQQGPVVYRAALHTMPALHSLSLPDLTPLFLLVRCVRYYCNTGTKVLAISPYV